MFPEYGTLRSQSRQTTLVSYLATFVDCKTKELPNLAFRRAARLECKRWSSNSHFTGHFFMWCCGLACTAHACDRRLCVRMGDWVWWGRSPSIYQYTLVCLLLSWNGFFYWYITLSILSHNTTLRADRNLILSGNFGQSFLLILSVKDNPSSEQRWLIIHLFIVSVCERENLITVIIAKFPADGMHQKSYRNHKEGEQAGGILVLYGPCNNDKTITNIKQFNSHSHCTFPS